eukprot:m.347375 g.347375  ORF g.347375 m.347375 type:complete len:1353 (+) comp19865_c1_seq8:97-4155(+)
MSARPWPGLSVSGIAANQHGARTPPTVSSASAQATTTTTRRTTPRDNAEARQGAQGPMASRRRPGYVRATAATGTASPTPRNTPSSSSSVSSSGRRQRPVAGSLFTAPPAPASSAQGQGRQRSPSRPMSDSPSRSTSSATGPLSPASSGLLSAGRRMRAPHSRYAIWDSSGGGSPGRSGSRPDFDPLSYSSSRPLSSRQTQLARRSLDHWKDMVGESRNLRIADAHRRRYLLKACFAAWQGLARREFVLQVRADWHQRRWVLQQSMQRWRAGVAERQRQARLLAQADQHATQALLRKVLRAFDRHCVHRQNKRVLSAYAQAAHRRHVLARCWQHWTRALRLKHRLNRLNTRADRFIQHRLAVKYLLLWRERFHAQQHEQRMLMRADDARAKLLVWRAWQGWRWYVGQRRRKRLADEAAAQHSCRRLARKHWRRWRAAMLQRQTLRRLVPLADERGRRVILRVCLAAWRRYAIGCRERRKATAKARQHYTQALARRVFRGLAIMAAQARQREAALAEVLRVRHRALIARGWAAWRTRWEATEEMRLFPAMQQAARHNHSTLLARCLSGWRSWAKASSETKRVYEWVGAMADRRLLAKYFSLLCRGVVVSAMEHRLEVQADGFRRDVLLGRTFGTWRLLAELSARSRDDTAAAVAYRRRHLASLFFRLWRAHLSVSRRQRLLEHEMTQQFNFGLVAKCFGAWRHFVVLQQIEQHRQAIADQLVRQRRLRLAWVAWRDAYRDSMLSRFSAAKAVLHANTQRTRQTFARWRQFVAQCRRQRRQQQQAIEVYKVALRTKALSTWRYQLVCRQRDKQFQRRATGHRTDHVARRILKAWRAEVVRKREKAAATATQVRWAQNQLALNKARRVLVLWRQRARETKAMADKDKLASAHQRRRLLLHCLTAWDKATILARHHAAMEQRAKSVHQVKVARRAFGCWRVAFLEARASHMQRRLALWYWSQKLKRKVFDALLAHVADRRRLARRTAATLAYRRTRLLRQGLRHWVQVADANRLARVEALNRSSAASAVGVNACVVRCARRWLRATFHRTPRVPPVATTGRGPSGARAAVKMPGVTQGWTITSSSSSSAGGAPRPQPSGGWSDDDGLVSLPRATPRIPAFLHLYGPPPPTSLSSSTGRRGRPAGPFLREPPRRLLQVEQQGQQGQQGQHTLVAPGAKHQQLNQHPHSATAVAFEGVAVSDVGHSDSGSANTTTADQHTTPEGATDHHGTPAEAQSEQRQEHGQQAIPPACLSSPKPSVNQPKLSAATLAAHLTSVCAGLQAFQGLCARRDDSRLQCARIRLELDASSDPEVRARVAQQLEAATGELARLDEQVRQRKPQVKLAADTAAQLVHLCGH